MRGTASALPLNGNLERNERMKHTRSEQDSAPRSSQLLPVTERVTLFVRPNSSDLTAILEMAKAREESESAGTACN